MSQMMQAEGAGLSGTHSFLTIKEKIREKLNSRLEELQDVIERQESTVEEVSICLAKFKR